MRIKNACFISYCHGQNELIKGFIEQLCRALKNYLEPLMDEGVYVDYERLQPGYRFNEALARDICESVCMIVVYYPRYEQHSYCRREFAAMEIMEEHRKALLGAHLHGRGFIIPVILTTGADGVPDKIKGALHYSDFSGWTLASSDISRNPDFIPAIKDICTAIHELYELLRQKIAAGNQHMDCVDFRVPAEADAPPWQHGGTVPGPLPFPGRKSAP